MKIENIVSKKVLLIELEGFAQTETAVNFVEEYNKAVSKIKGKGYTLIVDSSNLSTFKPDILPILANCYKLYMSSDFVRIFMINPKQGICKMQVQRVAKNTNFSGVFLDSLDDAMKRSL